MPRVLNNTRFTQLPCESCGAKPGEHCKSKKTGQPLPRFVHPKRVRAFNKWANSQYVD
jgi:hypothetical protein